MSEEKLPTFTKAQVKTRMRKDIPPLTREELVQRYEIEQELWTTFCNSLPKVWVMTSVGWQLCPVILPDCPPPQLRV